MSGYKPPISTLISTDAIPGGLGGFIQEGIENIFSNLYFKNFKSDVQITGDEASYNLVLITHKRLAFNIPGTQDLALVINPDFDGVSSEFSIYLHYKWSVLKNINNFKISNFDFTHKTFYNLLFNLINIDDADLLIGFIDLFFAEDDLDDPIQEFIDDFNTNNNPPTSIVKPLNSDERVIIENILLQLQDNGNDYNIAEVIFNDYLLPTDNFGTFENKIILLFTHILGSFSFENLKHIIFPKFIASLNDLNLSLEFPRSILKPINEQTNEPHEDESIKSMLTFTVGTLEYSTDYGFNFINSGSFNFTKSQIGNTGFTLEFTNAKLDLSRTTSIPEITTAGYPNDFVGAFIEEAAIGLPSFLQTDEDVPSGQQAQIIGKNLIIGTGGFSGQLILDDSGNQLGLKLGNQSGFSLSFDAFSISFQQNSIVESSIHGTMKIPGFKDTTGGDAEINIDVWIGTNGEFSVTASEDQGITALRIPNILDFNINSLSIGRKGGRFFVAVSGAIHFQDMGGFIGQFIPEKIDIQKLLIWQDGQMEYEGGTLVLPNAITMKIGPVELSVTAVGFGSHEQEHQGIQRQYKFFEFSGGISVNPGNALKLAS